MSISLLSIFNELVGMHIHSFGKSLLAFFFFGIIGTIALTSVSKFLRLPEKIIETFMQGAIFYICMHTIMFEYMILIWNKVTGDFSGNTIIEKIVVTALTFIVSYPIIRFMIKYTPLLLGKQIKKQ